MLDALVEFNALEGELMELVKQVSGMRGNPVVLQALQQCAPGV